MWSDFYPSKRFRAVAALICLCPTSFLHAGAVFTTADRSFSAFRSNPADFLRLKTGNSRLITTESRNNRAVRSTNEFLCPEKLLNSVIFYYGIVNIFSFAVVKWLQKAGKGHEFRKSLLRTYSFSRIIVVNIRGVSSQKPNRAVAGATALSYWNNNRYAYRINNSPYLTK